MRKVSYGGMKKKLNARNPRTDAEPLGDRLEVVAERMEDSHEGGGPEGREEVSRHQAPSSEGHERLSGRVHGCTSAVRGLGTALRHPGHPICARLHTQHRVSVVVVATRLLDP